MKSELKDAMVLYKPTLSRFEREGICFFIDSDTPNWIATDDRGKQILDWVDGIKSLGEILCLYSGHYHLDFAKSWRDVHAFVSEGIGRGMLSDHPVNSDPYLGRHHYLIPSLKEFWMHIVQTCNLSCTHCLVSSGPRGERGQEKEFYLNAIDQAFKLGVRRFYFTGGEPFIREDIFDLIRYVTEEKNAELIILTNAMLLQGKKQDKKIEELADLNPGKLKFQISLDGTCPTINDPIRGEGVFKKSCEGIKLLSGFGFDCSLTAVVTQANLIDLQNLPALAERLGARSVHLMWLHKRGRILDTGGEKAFPDTIELLTLARLVKEESQKRGLLFDNVESLKLRANGQPGVKHDLGNQCWESLCLYSDGHLYPSAAMAGFSPFSLGDLKKRSVEDLWLGSPVAKKLREASLIQQSDLAQDPFRFLTGGGDMDYATFFSANGGEKEDFYYGLYVELMKDTLFDLARSKKESLNLRAGVNPPSIYHAMGEDAITCSEDAQAWLVEGGLPKVRTIHSNCVLSFDVEKPHRLIQEFYGEAARTPQKELCCPVTYDQTEVGHIPQEVLDRFYGCSSPISLAGLRLGETVLDLGSGAGIDCFIAARKVGPTGKVIGVDMTDAMLEAAQTYKGEVAKNIGYDVVEFRKGYLENIPAEDKSIDLVTSNCVVNLSPDKKRVFAEIWRILKDNGRMVVADIVSDQSVPLSLQAHPDLWGECISGALSQEAFFSGLEKAGFYGISLLKKSYWKEVEGYPFYSITVRAFKFEKKAGCVFVGHQAIYLGPFKAVLDEEGHLFPRDEAVTVCTDTVAKLNSSPYAGHFLIVGLDGQSPDPLLVEATDCSGESCCP